MFESIALASVKINETYANKSLLFAAIAIAALIIFQFIRGSSASESENEKHFPSTPHTFSEWLPTNIKSYSAASPASCEKWNIRLFATERVGENKSFRATFNGYFVLGTDSSEVDRILAPLVRKVFLKYRESFEKDQLLKIHRETHSKTQLTWLNSEAQMRFALFRFLDEVLSISESLEVRPTLEVTWTDTFVFSVNWVVPGNVPMELIRDAFQVGKGLEFVEQENRIKLSLWLAFPSDQIPEKLLKGPAPGPRKVLRSA